MSEAGTNANRKYAQDIPWKLSMSIPESLRVQIDTARGEQSRMAWIMDACLAKLEGRQCPF